MFWYWGTLWIYQASEYIMTQTREISLLLYAMIFGGEFELYVEGFLCFVL